MKKLMTLLMALGLLLITIIGTPVAAKDLESVDFKALENPFFHDTVMQQENETEPQIIHLYLKGGEEGELRVEMPEGNASTDVDCNGHYTARWLGYYIGTWISPPLAAPITVGTEFSCGLWVYSNEGAKNVHFSVHIQVNGNDEYDFWTESTSVSSTPTEITGEGSNSNSIQLQAGDTVGVRLAYFSDPKYYLGPGADSKLIVGSAQYDTHVKISANPMTVSVNEPLVDEGFITFSATYIDAFSSTKLNALLRVDGGVDVETISHPTFSVGGNGSTVTWIWDYKSDGGRDGEYTVTISLSYCEENDFRAMGTYMIDLPGGDEGGGIIGGIVGLLPIIIVVIAAVVAAVILMRLLKSRKEAGRESPT
ncbi:MAG: hypothetical protein JSV09_06740 [Thermoplasmata archaeon]|nr:MAG: hypothetical protein JSV09_06740 [Thermoplasmata archaeon]